MTASGSTIKEVLTGLDLLMCCRMGAERESTIKITSSPSEESQPKASFPLPTPHSEDALYILPWKVAISSERAE